MYIDIDPYLQAKNKSVTDGCSLSDMREILTSNVCPTYFMTQAAELCAEFIIDTYGMDGSINDTERVIQFIKFAGWLLLFIMDERMWLLRKCRITVELIV
mgnify:CR=1 FL=1